MSRRVRATLLVALVVLGVVELGLRLGGDRVGFPQYWYSPTADALDEEMSRLVAAGVSSDMVLAGSSMTQFGILPRVLENDLDSVAAAHNAGIPKGYAPVMELWLLDEVVERLEPRRVVWGLSSLDFNGGREVPILEEYRSSRASTPGVFGDLDRALWRVSSLSRYRDHLREPDFLFSRPDPPFVESPDRPLEELMSPVRWPRLEQNETTLAALTNSILRDFHIGSEHAAAFEATIRRLQALDIEVVVALLPVSQPYVDAHPDGEAGYLAFVEWIHGEAERLGVPIFDYGRAIPEDRFLDFNHIDEEGATVLTEMLAADLAGLGW